MIEFNCTEKQAEANLYMAGVLGKNQQKSSPEIPGRNLDEDQKIKDLRQKLIQYLEEF